MNNKFNGLICILSLLASQYLWADTGLATLDRPRGYDTATHAFVDDLSLQDSTDGGFAFDIARGSASASFSGTYYSAVVREVVGTARTHIFLLRNTGLRFEGWDQDTKSWTTAYANMDPIDSHISQGMTAANPAMAVDSQGNVYIAYTRTDSSGSNRRVFLSKYDVVANEMQIWDDGASQLTDDLSAADLSTDSIGANGVPGFAGYAARNVAPAIAINRADDVYIAFVAEGQNTSTTKVYLSRFDAAAEDVFIWRDSATAFSNDLTATVTEDDSIGLNTTGVGNQAATASPTIAIDNNDVVYIAFTQATDFQGLNRLWLSRYDPVAADVAIWRDNLGAFSNNLQAAFSTYDSFGNNHLLTAGANNALGTPAIGIDSQNNVYVAYRQYSSVLLDPKAWLSKYDAAANDVFIWHGRQGVDAFTNNQAAPNGQLDSFGVNVFNDANASGTPALLIDNSDNVWVSHVQQTSPGADPHVWLSKYDAAMDDVFIWDDASSSLTNNQTVQGGQSGISWNAAADLDAVGSPSIAMAANGDIYVAYANAAVVGSGNPHVSVSYFDVSGEDALVWNDGPAAWTNDLQAPATFTDSLDNSSADGDRSFNPIITATTNGIYLSFLHRADGTNDHMYYVRIGAGDSDNDGTLDANDAFPADPAESADTDNDGIGNNADTDDDNDGVLDVNDAFPLDSTETVDTDGDGAGNNADTDDDNDGVADTNDAFPLDNSESVDTDGDGIGNNADTDDDNDGVLDINDPFPLDDSLPAPPNTNTGSGTGSTGGGSSIGAAVLTVLLLLVMVKLFGREYLSRHSRISSLKRSASR